jgi:hypothetical protein
MFAVSDGEDAAPEGDGAAAPCGKCGQAQDLLTILPRLGDRPTYNVFRCIGCGFVEWIAEQVGN